MKKKSNIKTIENFLWNQYLFILLRLIAYLLSHKKLTRKGLQTDNRFFIVIFLPSDIFLPKIKS